MAELTRRVQILMTDEEYDFLKSLSDEKRRSVGDLIRSAVAKQYRPSSSVAHLWALDEIKDTVYLNEDSLPST
ncbi:MAG: hypothetical protein OEZ34_06175 [Spirochaetia bacterium]|nr:hypothetical protein [Spirochaetia bacterium]